MGRRRKNENEVQENRVPELNYSTPSTGYSDWALKALDDGRYGKARQGEIASYKMKEARKKVPALQPTQQNAMANARPATRYENQPASMSAPKSTRDKKYDADFDEFYDWRYNNADRMDYDAATDTETEHWRNVKKDIMAKNNWSEKEFDDRWNAYDKEKAQEIADKEVNFNKAVAEKNSLLGTLSSFMYLPQAMAEGVGTALEAITGKNMASQDYNPQLTATRSREAARTAVQDKIQSNAGKTAYNIGTGLGDMVLSSAVPGVGVAALGGETAARTQLNALNRGIDERKAAGQGTASGVVSAAMNKVGLDKAINTTGKTALASIAKAAGKEGLENVLEDAANVGLDTYLNKNKSELYTLHDYYTSQGLSDDDAWSQVAKDKGIDLLTSFGSGAAFGAFMKGGEVTANAVLNKIGDDKSLGVGFGTPEPESSSPISQNVPPVNENVNSASESAPKNPWGRTADSMIAEDSYARGEDYKTLTRSIREFDRQIDDVGNQIKSLESELKKETVGKVRLSKDDLAKIDSMDIDDQISYIEQKTGIKMGEIDAADLENLLNGKPIDVTSENGESLQAQIRELRNQQSELERQRSLVEEDRDYIKANARLSQLENYNQKEFVPAARDKYQGFSTTKGQMNDRVGYDARLVEMSPDEYIQRCAYEIFGQGDSPSTLESVLQSRSQADIDNYAQMMLDGAEFDTPYLDYKTSGQEGLHRALAAKEAGIDTIPVVVRGEPSDASLLGYSARRRMADIDLARGDRWLDEHGFEDLVDDDIIEEIEGTQNKVPSVEPTEIPRQEVPAVKPLDADGEEKVRSFSKRGSMDEELPEEVRNSLSEDTYKVVRNAETTARAEEMYDPSNLAQTHSNLKQAIDNHDPASALLAYKLAKSYVDEGNYDAATDVLEEVSKELTRMGQFTQAAKLAMMQNDPMAALRTYERELQKLNQWGSKKYKGKWDNLKLSKEDIDLFNSVQKGDSDGLNAVVDQLNEKFGKQIPANWWDKVVGASKTAMLLNPRTQFRNVLANLATLPIRSASDRVAAVGQNIAHLINPDIEVTQSVTGGTKAQKQIASQIFENMRGEITGENKMKDNVQSDILGHRQIFNNDAFATWIDNLTDGGIQKLNERFGADGNTSSMETLQNLTYWLMGDVGDTPFVKKNFVNRLASYMKAQGITNIDDVPDDAIAIATQEALKATFKDDNAFTKALQGVKQKSGKFGEVALPFVKTPANLTMRAIDYSPAGLINTFRKIRSGAEANAVIDELSKNLTGTAMIYLGYKLAEKGLISGAYSSDKDEASFQKQQGMMEYAIHVPDGVPGIGGSYLTYDWTQPAATPLVLGTTIYEAVKNSDKDNGSIEDLINGTYRGGLNVANTVLNSSPLQSLSDLLGSDGTDEGGIAENIANEIIEFPQRLIPSVLGATARTVDPVMRDTYMSNNDTLTGMIGNQLRSAQAKIPFLSKTLPASYDTWGNERRRSDSVPEAFAAQMINPGQFGNENITPLDSEIQRIFDATGDAKVFPRNAARKLDLGSDGNITLTNKQHSEYQKLMGQTSYKYAESLMNNPDFKALSDDEKATVLDKAYGLSQDLAKEKLFNHTTDSNKELKEIARTKSPKAVAEYLLDGMKAKELGMTMSTYQKKEAENPGGAVEYANNKQTAEQLGMSTDHYTKVLDKAGDQRTAVENALPVLVQAGLPDSSHYTYAKAVNVIPSLTPDEFISDWNEIDTDRSGGIKQQELLDFINSFDYDNEQEAIDLWNAYGEWKNKQGVLKKLKWNGNEFIAEY